MNSTNQITESDISDGGSLMALLGLGLNVNTASSENDENQQDQQSLNNKTYYVAIEHYGGLKIEVDQGIHGANIERLKKISKLHHKTPSTNEKQGCHNMGSKAHQAFFTNLFIDDEHQNEVRLDPFIKQILDKQYSERTLLETLLTTVTVISKTDEYDEAQETAINQINLDFISPVHKKGLYKNEPKQATPFSIALWNAFSINADMPGTIIITPVCFKRHQEYMIALTSRDIEKNRLLYYSKTYNKFILAGTKMEINMITMDIKKENGIKIEFQPLNITGLTRSSLKAVYFDPLHLDDIKDSDKMTATYLVYEKNKELENILKQKKESNTEDEEGEYEKFMASPHLLTLFNYEKKTRRISNKNPKGEPVAKEIAKKDLEKEVKHYKKTVTIDEKGAYHDDWAVLDKQIIEAIYTGEIPVDEFTNLKSLNGHNLGRNNKITETVPPPFKNSGDFSVRKAYEHSRFMTSYNADMDRYVPPQQIKSETKYKHWPEEIKLPIEWVHKHFREKIGKMYKPAAQPEKKKTVKKTEKKKPALVIEALNESDDDFETESVVVSTLDAKVEYESDLDLESDTESDTRSDTYSSSTSEESEINRRVDSISSSESSENIRVIVEDTRTSQLAQFVAEPIVPTVVPRCANRAEYVTKEDCINAIDNWFTKLDIHNELDKDLAELFRANNLIHEFVFESVYSKISIEDKVQIIKQYLNTKYPIGTEKINGGIAFIRQYRIHLQL